MDSERYLSRIKDMLSQVLTGCKVYLFGSRATGRCREMLEDSDIPFTVDLVDLSAASREFVEKVQREGMLLWKG